MTLALSEAGYRDVGFLASLIYDGSCVFCWGWELKDRQDIPKRIWVSLWQSLPAPL